MHRTLVERAGSLEAVDPVGGWLDKLAAALLPTPSVKDFLSGTWLGHPLHPALTDAALGTWMSATLLDVLGSPELEGAARRLVGIGVLASLPTAAAGLADWSDTGGETRRIGTVHALTNLVVLECYAASWLFRRAGQQPLGKAFSVLGAGVSILGAYLGSHLIMRQGVGVDQTIFEALPHDWRPVLDDDQLQEGAMQRVAVDGVGVLVARWDGRVLALADRCTHRGGPLHEGHLQDGRVTCPWHGSTFSLEDGSIVRGPATAPEPAFDVRVREGRIEVRFRSG